MASSLGPEVLSGPRAGFPFPRGPVSLTMGPVESRADIWAALEEQLPFREGGGIDWDRRYFAKRWSARRLGWAAIEELLSEVIAPKRPCCALGEDRSQLGVETTLRAGLRAWREAEGFAWLVDKSGRWVLERDPEGIVSLEFVSRRSTRMVERLQKLEQRWKGDREGPSSE